MVSGTYQGGDGQAGDVDGVQIALVLHQRLGQMLGGQNADDIFRLVPPQRHAAVVAWR